MSDTDEFDIVVIGGGPVGENAAQYAVEGTDLTAAIVEGELLGGECSYYACMPSKALLRPLQVRDTAGDLGGLQRPGLDLPGLLARRDAFVSGYDDAGQASWAEEAGLAVVRGTGRLTGARAVAVQGIDADVADRTLVARRAVILATGSEPVVPDLFRDALPWGSRDATGVKELPGRLLIVGGGVVACEAATWFGAMGTDVVMVVREGRLLDRTEPFAGEAVLAALQARGVTVHLETEVTACDRDEPVDTGLGRIHGGTVTLATTAGPLRAAEVLVATGRRPRLDDLGLDSIGLSPEDVLAGRMPDWLFAVGDAGGEAPLTHWGKYRARVIGEQIAAGAGAPAAYSPRRDIPVPQVVFTDPEVATVGLTEREARSSGLDVVMARVPISAAAGVGLLRDHPTGDAQLVVDGSRGVLVGATFVGPEVGELVHGATIAIVGQVPVHLLRHAVPSYPTASELWLRLLESLPRSLRSPA